jgi:hypothetical protein
MNEYTIEKVTIIKKSTEILFEHYQKRGFKDLLIEGALKNILGMCDSILEDIEPEKNKR